MKANYNEDVVEDMVDDIKYLEGMEIEIEWDVIDLNQYSPKANDNDKVEAFKRCGYSLKF